ncbi:hypothetical protein [uncultured Tateyamaria sp.]|uniref:hypothetical protein n=1 Tax=uncultured Tateyamaria sp. TaxID=455651 RepID=UPI0026125393|nr:hypothetical protein [uncultured Tateyamaria sp.]
MNELRLANMLSLCIEALRAKGYELEQVAHGSDADVRAARVRSKDRSKPFALDKSDFSKAEAFWLFLKKDGQDVAFAAARVNEFEWGELAGYLDVSYRRLYPDCPFFIPKAPQTLLRLMHGRVVYLGELFFSPSHRGDAPNLRLFVHALFCLCVIKLRADWMFAFVPKKHDRFGYGRLYGFPRLDDAGFQWVKVPPGRRQETVCAISSGDLDARAEFFSCYPEQLTEVFADQK